MATKNDTPARVSAWRECLLAVREVQALLGWFDSGVRPRSPRQIQRAHNGDEERHTCEGECVERISVGGQGGASAAGVVRLGHSPSLTMTRYSVLTMATKNDTPARVSAWRECLSGVREMRALLGWFDSGIRPRSP